MKRILTALLLLISASSLFAAGDQAYLGMFAETSSMKMAGMPAMPALPPGTDLSKLENVPGMEQMLAMMAPQRKFDIRLWSPGIAPQNASASVAPPDGLKQGNKLDLDIYRPAAETGTGETGGEGPGGASMADFTIKFYWGSSATVKPGQPKIVKFVSLTSEQKRAMSSARRKVGTSSYFYKPDWTTAYWPTKAQPGRISKDAALPGTYTLTTNYTGNVAIDCPKDVDFLTPIEITSPSLAEAVNLVEAIKFEWNPIPNLLGSHARIIGMEGKNTLVMWSSSEVWRDDAMSVDWGYLQMAEVKQFVKDTIMMAGDRKDVTVPAGIFKDCDMASFMMVGYGPGAARDGTQPLPRIQTKTTLTIMLGGKNMPGASTGEGPTPPGMG